MPSYKCVTCNEVFSKLKKYREHCKSTGHQLQSQGSALVKEEASKRSGGSQIKPKQVKIEASKKAVCFQIKPEKVAQISLTSALGAASCQTQVERSLPQSALGIQGMHVMLTPVRVSGGQASVEMVVDVGRARVIASMLAGLPFVALDCEGVNLSATGELTLLQVAFSLHNGEFSLSATGERTPLLECYVKLFDVCALGQTGMDAISEVLEAQAPIKVVHDVHNDAASLKAQFGINLTGVFDTQLAYEATQGKMLSSLSEVLQQWSLSEQTVKEEGRRLMNQSPDIWKRRPLHPTLASYAALDVALLLDVWTKFTRMHNDQIPCILEASASRCLRPPEHAAVRPVIFDQRRRHQMRSYELALAEWSADELSSNNVALDVQDSIASLVCLLPKDLRQKLGPGNLLQGLPPSHKVRDIILDLGQRPRAFFGHRNLVFLEDDPAVKVTQADLDHVQEQLEDKFGPDNRAGINGCLHRISAMRAKAGKVYGLTMRVGRAIFGNTNLITDLLLGTNSSILFLGTPGCGKTTIIREAARILSEDAQSVVVVDTSNEICGDGLVPHPAIGLARRMMVPSLEHQAGILIEAVQNHTPDVIVVDEIGRAPEVEAARTVKERGVRILGSAHGDLRGLVKNTLLNDLVGGTESVTVGDAEARKRQANGGEFSKVRTQRSGTPVFDVVIELQPGSFHQWQVTNDVPKAIDRILAGQHFPTQVRARDPVTGLISVELLRS